MERFRYDRSSKWLIEHQGRLILYLGDVRDVEECRTTQAEVVQPRQLPDGLLEVRRRGQQQFHPFIIEIETYPERRTANDLLDDIMLVYQDRRVLPDVLVLVLHPKGNARIESEIRAMSNGGLTSLVATWRVVNLWNLKASDLLATGEPGLMPWVPLTHIDGDIEPILRECRRIIDENANKEVHANLLAVTQVLMGLNYNDPRLFALFGGSEAMIESPVLTNLIAERIQQVILGILNDRIGEVPSDVRVELAGISNEARLSKLAQMAARVTDYDQFRENLRG